ncbi:branched-chain amino acid ABC transporter permease [Pigmentiphaga soli]|uniref:Branched-chain amino acid ABC transporter permease n=1 Tax=Pigmentiphaga soli TaxID=1007095 RepID=A0ABP8H445_9BURK
MQYLIVLEQLLNGVQLGVTLFLLAAGLTLVFGIMNLINLAHGAMYMVGAYLCASAYLWSGSFAFAVAAALVGALALGVLVEVAVFRKLYQRSNLDQVLATFAVLLISNELIRIIWGPGAINAPLPDFLSGQVQVLPGVPYPTIRLAILTVGLAAALLLYLLIGHTRLGMLIRAGASNRVMIGALGVNIRLLYTAVFGLGAMLAALAGLMAGPISSVEPGMGDKILILALAVIVIGGVGSVRGAFIGALMIGIIDTAGRVFLRPLLQLLLSPAAAESAGPALASILIYVAMAAVLFFRPRGLFPPRVR